MNSNQIKISEIKKDLLWMIAIAFFISSLSFVISIFFPPQLINGVISMTPILIFLGRMQSAMFIVASTAFSIWLAEKKETIGAIGFGLLSIAYGIVLVLYIISINSTEDLNEAFQLFSGSMFIMIPGYLVLLMFKRFKLWMRIIGLMICCFYLAENLCYLFNGSYNKYMMMIDAGGNMLTNFLSFMWAMSLVKEIRTAKQSEA